MISKGIILDGTYEVISEIGAGGGGIVYKARHLRLQTDVVIKKIKDEVRGKVKLRQEVDILKELKHPYLPRVYDFIETEDGVYTIMDFIQGEDLDTVIKRERKINSKLVKKWAEQLGDVLGYLHSQKPAIIHSDIKPANIMITEKGDICLIDFNISLAAGANEESAVGVSLGFSPPEQYRDPVLYARVTKNYTLQKLSKAISEANSSIKIDVSEAKKSLHLESDEDCTELLSNVLDENKTIFSNNMLEEDKTVLLNNMSDEDKTVLLNSMSDEDKTVLLNNMSDEDKTVFLNSMPEEDKTALLAIQSPDIKKDTGLKTSQIKAQTKEYAKDKLPLYTKYMGRGIDTRSDIYSLGVTLYYLVTGIEPPVDFDKRIPIMETNVEISEGFAIILEKMMELNPEDRFQNGMEYYEAITNCHKLDKRYISMKRKQTGMQFAALACLFVGIILVFLGLYKLRTDKNSTYYALLQKAEECMQAGEYDVASSFLTQAKEEAASRVAAYGDEVYLLFLSGKYEECITIGETYINTMPFVLESKQDKEVFGNIYYIVGNAYFELEEYVNALYLLEGALQYNTQNGLYYRDCAITLAKLGQIDKAQQFLEKSVELGIEQDSVLMVQAELAHANGLYEEALSTLEQVMSVTKDDQMKKRAILLSVAVYKAIGNDAIDEEITLLEKYSKVFEEKGSLVMLEYLADAYVRKAGTDASVTDTYYNKALSLFQGILDKGYVTYQLKENMAILYENMDSFEEAEKILLQMAEEYPKRYEVYKRLAYLEADRQQNRDIENRSYDRMREYYEIAKEKYSGKEQDMEMEMLERMMQELQDGGWF